MNVNLLDQIKFRIFFFQSKNVKASAEVVNKALSSEPLPGSGY